MIVALKSMPWLAIILIAFLLWIGMRATRPRTIRYRQLYILPSVFLAISANQMLSIYAWNIQVFAAWATAVVVVGTVSWWAAQRMPVRIDRSTGMIDLPGTWITLSVILAFIAARLYSGRMLYVTPEIRFDTGFATNILAMSGGVTGYYLGRSGAFLSRYFLTKE